MGQRFIDRVSSFSFIPRVYGQGRTYAEEYQLILDEINRQNELVQNVIDTVPTIVQETVKGELAEIRSLVAEQNTVIAELRNENRALRSHVDEQVDIIRGSTIEISDPVIFGVLSDELGQSAALVKSWINE